MNSWSRNELVGVFALLIGLVACLAGLAVVPEVRSLLGLPRDSSDSSPTADERESPNESRPTESADSSEPAGRPQSAEEAARVLESYWSAVNSQDYRQAWELLSSSFRSRNHGGDYLEYVRDQAAMQVCSVTARDSQTIYFAEQKALVSATVVFRVGAACRQSPEPFTFHMLRLQAGGWVIDSVVRK